MLYSRRKTLALIGGGVVIAAAASSGAFLATRTPAEALLPWDRAGGSEEPRMYALSWAILAPNPHNRQPWTAQMIGVDRVRIFRDRSRNLPHTDPFDRQLTIGMGCFLELMALAAAQKGYAITFELFPDGEEGAVADALFIANRAQPDPLFAYGLARRSCKKPFLDKKVPEEEAKWLGDYAHIIVDEKRVEALRALTFKAWMVEALTKRTMQESVDLMRFGRAEIERNPDGIALGGPFLETLMMAGLLSRADQATPTSNGFKQGVSIYKEMLAATPAYAVLASPTNTRLDQIEAGRRWLRLNLATAARGLALHPVSQCLQEFPEMAECYQDAHALLVAPSQTVQMLGRLGYGPQTPRTPRWPIESRLINV